MAGTNSWNLETKLATPWSCSAVTCGGGLCGDETDRAVETEEYLEDFAMHRGYPAKLRRLAGSLKYDWARKGVTIEISDASLSQRLLSCIEPSPCYGQSRRLSPCPELKHLDLPTTLKTYGHSNFSRRDRHGDRFEVSAGGRRRTPDGRLRTFPGRQGTAAAQLESAARAAREHSMAAC